MEKTVGTILKRKRTRYVKLVGGVATALFIALFIAFGLLMILDIIVTRSNSMDPAVIKRLGEIAERQKEKKAEEAVSERIKDAFRRKKQRHNQ